MSFITGLRASTSTSRYMPLHLATPSAPFHLHRRYASTVQEMDAQLEANRRKIEDQKRQMAKLRARGSSVYSDPYELSKLLPIPVLESTTVSNDAPPWFSILPIRTTFFKDRYKYGKWVFQQVRGNSQMIDQAAKLDMVEIATKDERKAAGSFLQRSLRFLKGDLSWNILPSLRHAQDLYNQFHTAQASGDIKTIDRISFGELHKYATRVAKSGVKMKWELAETPKLPSLSWIRSVPVDPHGHCGQICLVFDTQQKLTRHTGSSPPVVKTIHVKEAIVFDMFALLEKPPFWRLREKVQLSQPYFTLDGKGKEEWDQRIKKHESNLQAMNEGR